MLRSLCALAVAAIMIGGCATYPDVNLQRLESLPQHYAQFDAVVGWGIRSTSPETIIDGAFRNIRYMYMKDVEIRVEVLNRAGKTEARSTSFLFPTMLQRDDTTPFTFKLPVSVTPGTKLRFTYKYTAIEGASDGGGDVGNWMQSFVAEVPRQ